MRINNRLIFYGNFLENGIIYVKDLLFDTDTSTSFKIISSKISKIIFLIWAGLRHSVPSQLKTNNGASAPLEILLSLTIDNKDFDVLKKKSKDYYTLIKRAKAQFPNCFQHLRQTFNLSEDDWKSVFWLRHYFPIQSCVR